MTVVVGILLAAGEGTRFAGGNKLLAEVDEQPIVVKAARGLCESPVEACLAVLGYEAERIGAALSGISVELTVNPNFKDGQATSVRRGLTWAQKRGADAVIVALGDMPWVAPSTYEALIDAHRDGAGIVVPEYDGDRGNPVLFDAEYFSKLARVQGDSGGRQLFARFDVTRVPVDDPGVRRDIDEPDDLPSRSD